MRLIILFLGFLLFGCASETQQNGLDEVAKLYDAKVTFSKGFHTSSGRKTIKKFNVKISNSKAYNNISIGEKTSNIAFTVFKNFNDKEKDTYSFINTEFIKSNQDTVKNSYATSLLKMVLQKSKSFMVFSEAINNKKFEEIENFKNRKYLTQNVEDVLKKHISKLNQLFGEITSYDLVGLSEVTEGDKTFIRYTGYFKFSRGKKIKYFVSSDIETGEGEIFGFKIFK